MGTKSASETEYKATIDIALVSMNSAILINGGAAIAILAFWGSLLGVATSSVDSSHIANALKQFASGVLLGGVATLLAYLTQRVFSFISASSRWGMFLNVASILSVALGYWCFYRGIIECQAALLK